MFRVGDRVAVKGKEHLAITVHRIDSNNWYCCWHTNGTDGYYFFYKFGNLQLLTKENKMFQLTSGIDNEIIQLQQKLAELEQQKQLLSSRESCANKILEDVKECVVQMREAGVSGDKLTGWAKAIYEVITGVPIADEPVDCAELLTRIERLKELLKEKNDEFDKKYSESRQELLERDRDVWRYKEELDGANAKLAIATQEISDLKNALAEASMQKADTALALLSEPVKTPLASDCVEVVSIPCSPFEIGDIVQCENGKVGTVSYVPEPFAGIVTVNVLGQSVGLHASNLKLISPVRKEEVQSPDAEMSAQAIAANFLQKIDRFARAESATWSDLKELPLNLEVFLELGAQARTKSQKHLLEQMPSKCAAYIQETNDNSDFDWLPTYFVEDTRKLLNPPATNGDEANDSPVIPF